MNTSFFQTTPASSFQTTAAEMPARFDLYGSIHKALRALMSDTLLSVGRMDSEDDLDLAQTTQQVQQLLEFCNGHLGHENAFVHPAMERRAPGSAARVAQEHEDHVRAITGLAQSVDALLTAPRAQRARQADALYQQLALFVAENFEHMHVEETEHNAVLWAHYTDAELVEIHDALVATIPPEEMLFTARWLVPFMNPAGRAAMLCDMQAHAPAPVLQAVLDVSRPHLSDREWAKLTRDLGAPVLAELEAA